MKFIIRSRYADKGPRQQLKTEKSMTKQSFKDQCDINKIIAKHNQTGQLPGLILQNPEYGDFSDAKDYQQAMNTIIHAQSQFDALPSKVRLKFQNDPSQFLEFVSNPENAEELISMGIAKKIEKDPPPPVQDPAKQSAIPQADLKISNPS